MSKNSDKSSKACGRSMSELALEEAASLLRDVAGARRADESVKAVLVRVGRKLKGWSPSRVRSVWYRDPRVALRTGEIEELRAVAKAPADEAGGNELEELRARVARLERMLEQTDPAFHSPQIAAVRHIRREMGGTGGSLD